MGDSNQGDSRILEDIERQFHTMGNLKRPSPSVTPSQRKSDGGNNTKHPWREDWR